MLYDYAEQRKINNYLVTECIRWTKKLTGGKINNNIYNNMELKT